MHASISLHQRRYHSSTRTMLLKFCSADSEILKFVWKQTDLTTVHMYLLFLPLPLPDIVSFVPFSMIMSMY